MKRLCIILLLAAAFLPAVAQDPLVDLPWLPTRDTNHIRTIRTYKVDTLTGQRKLLSTEHYDRHGYDSGESYRMTYDRQGRLTGWESLSTRWPINDPKPRIIPATTYTLAYDAAGTVQYIRNVYYDTNVVEYRLINKEVHPRYGLIEYKYVRRVSGLDWTDTVYIRREYDNTGRMLREHCHDDGGDAYHEYSFFYDASGRLIACRNYYYEAWDTLDFNYASDGTLISQTGKMYDLDMEADVTISFRPDGMRQERREHWVNYSDPDDISDEYMRYDQRGVLVYWKSPQGVTEYEIEYWE